MAITLAPPAINVPSMEPYRHALLVALQTDLASALNIISDTFTQPPLQLPEPAVYTEDVVNSYDIPQQWPYLSVFSGAFSNTEPNQQLGGGIWKGELFVRCFLENSDGPSLTISLERYAAAIWLVLLNASEHRQLASAEVDYGSVEIQPDESGGVQNQRAVQVSCEIWFRV